MREEREDGSAGGGASGVGPSIGSARSPPRAIAGTTGGGRGGHVQGSSLGLGFGTGPSGGESTSGMGRPVATATATNTGDNATVAERFIIPSPLNLAVASSSSSNALIPPPRPQFTPLPVPLPFPTTGGATSSPSSGASGLALHITRRESSNSPHSATATGFAVNSPSPEIFSSSVSSHRNSQSPHPYPYPSSSLSSSPGAVPIRRPTATSGVGINPFKGNTLSSVSASVSGSSPSLSIRQGLSSGVAGGSPLSTGSFSSRIPPPSPVGSSTRSGFPLPPASPYGPAPSSLGDRKGLGMGEREYRGRTSLESDRGDWDREREDMERRGSNESGSRERDKFRRFSVGYGMGGPERQEDVIGAGAGGVSVPTRIPSTRKRYSSSFGNRYVGSGGSGGGVGSGAGVESGRSTPASVSVSIGAAGGVGVLEGGEKGKEPSVAGVSCLIALTLGAYGAPKCQSGLTSYAYYAYHHLLVTFTNLSLYIHRASHLSSALLQTMTIFPYSYKTSMPVNR